MSVQVRRRREAASFLATFVGAQGELLVDTTNNRVQVHDGVTPGGWPAAAIRDLAGFNLGINTNGAVNQRGVSGTVTLAAGAYGHDRMKGGANGCTYTFATAADGDTTFTVTAGSLIQAVDTPNVFATALWLTWTVTAAARVYQGAVGSAPVLAAGVAASIDGTSVNAILQSGLALGTITTVEFGTGTLNATRPWQLEVALPNAGPCRLGRRHGELALCRNYFRFAEPGIGTWYVGGSSAQAQLLFNYADMRPNVVPTIILFASNLFIADPGVANVTFSAASMSPNSIGVTNATMNFNAGNGTQAGSPTQYHVALLGTSNCVAISKEL